MYSCFGLVSVDIKTVVAQGKNRCSWLILLDQKNFIRGPFRGLPWRRIHCHCIALPALIKPQGRVLGDWPAIRNHGNLCPLIWLKDSQVHQATELYN